MTFLQTKVFFLTICMLVFLTACKEEEKIMSVRSIHEVQAKVDEILKIQKPEDVLVVLGTVNKLTK
jgi:hypothetical protein